MTLPKLNIESPEVKLFIVVVAAAILVDLFWDYSTTFQSID